MAFNPLPSRREELVVQRERMITGEIGRIEALLKTLDGQQDSLSEWMAWETEPVEGEESGACRDYNDFFSRTR